MNTTITNPKIKKEADQIKQRLAGLLIYGEEVKPENINALIVAAYYAGKLDSSGQSIQNFTTPLSPIGE